MFITLCKGKIHRATVTEACLDYRGSITIDEALLKEAGIKPYELLHINNMSSAVHWETYAIPGTKGQICLNGCPARLFQVGDEVIIMSFAQLSTDEAKNFTHKVVHVDKQNTITCTEELRVE
ncbi:aspartate 1-decarboxylase [bacterium BFN5]|nr:aspartate 1-decarboxylase [bacterium BFN5]